MASGSWLWLSGDVCVYVLNAGEIVEALPRTVCVCVCVCVCMHTCAHALNAEEIVRAIRATAQQSWGKQCVQVPRRAPFKVSPCLSLRHSHISWKLPTRGAAPTSSRMTGPRPLHSCGRKDFPWRLSLFPFLRLIPNPVSQSSSFRVSTFCWTVCL